VLTADVIVTSFEIDIIAYHRIKDATMFCLINLEN